MQLLGQIIRKTLRLSQKPVLAGLGALFSLTSVAYGIDGDNREARTLISAASQTKRVQLLMTIAWEGRDLQPLNLEAIRTFRNRFPLHDMAFVHLISPAYFVGENSEKNAFAIKSLLRPGDKVGLLASGWKNIVEGAGVSFRVGPTMWGEDIRLADCAVNCGQDVPIDAYTDEEIKKIMDHGIEILVKAGFGQPEILLASGWVASPAVLSAAASHDIKYDLSVVPPQLIENRAGAFSIYGWVQNLWPTVTPFSQPFETNTSEGTMIEIPQNLAAMDYLSDGQVLEIFKGYDKELTEHPDEPKMLQLSFYQETATQILPLLEKSLQEILAYAQNNAIGIQAFALDVPDAPAGHMELHSEQAAPVEITEPLAH